METEVNFLRIGTTVSFANDPRPDIISMEKSGVDSFWLYEIFRGYEAFARAGYLTAITNRAGIGIGVVNSYSRHPAITAMGATFLANLSGGRATLVIGIGGDSWVGRILGYDQPRPLERFGEFVKILQALFRGEVVSHHSGAFHLNEVQLNPAPAHPIPIYVACEHPGMMKIAARFADGVYLEPSCCPTGYIKWAVQTIKSALPQGKSFNIVANLSLRITSDLNQARSSMKPMLAFHLSFPDEGELYLERAGFPVSLAQRIGAASKIPELLRANRSPMESMESGALEKAALLVPDEFVDQCAVMGTAASCRDRLGELEKAGLTRVVFSLQEHLAENLRFLKELS